MLMAKYTSILPCDCFATSRSWTPCKSTSEEEFVFEDSLVRGALQGWAQSDSPLPL